MKLQQSSGIRRRLPFGLRLDASQHDLLGAVAVDMSEPAGWDGSSPEDALGVARPTESSSSAGSSPTGTPVLGASISRSSEMSIAGTDSIDLSLHLGELATADTDTLEPNVPHGYVVRYDYGTIGQQIRTHLPGLVDMLASRIPVVSASLAAASAQPAGVASLVPRTQHLVPAATRSGGLWNGVHLSPKDCARIMHIQYLASQDSTKHTPAAAEARELLARIATQCTSIPQQLSAAPEQALQAAHWHLAGQALSPPLWQEYCRWLNSLQVPAMHMRTLPGMPTPRFIVLNKAARQLLGINEEVCAAISRGMLCHAEHPEFAFRRMRAVMDAVTRRIKCFQSEAQMLRHVEVTNQDSGELGFVGKELMCMLHTFFDYQEDSSRLQSVTIYITDCVLGTQLHETSAAMAPAMLQHLMQAIAGRHSVEAFRTAMSAAGTTNMPIACLRVHSGPLLGKLFVVVLGVSHICGKLPPGALTGNVEMVASAIRQGLGQLTPAERADVEAQCCEALPEFLAVAKSTQSTPISLNIGGENFEI